MQEFDYENRNAPRPKRPKRRSTGWVVLHRITVGEGVKGIVDFFTQDPEGVATCTVGGFEKRLDAIRDWRKNGVPEWAKEKAYVPYHFLIGRDGKVYKMLEYDARGAHTAGYNNSSVGVGIVGDFRKDQPTGDQVLSTKRLCKFLLRKFSKDLDNNPVVSHDQLRAKQKKSAKHCPGQHFPVEEIKTWVYGAIGIMKMTPMQRY